MDEDYKPVCVKNDLTGKSFGRLTVQRLLGKKKNKVVYLCKCLCGKEKTVVYASLTGGTTRSCGCLHKDVFKQMITKYKYSRVDAALYIMWQGMLARCSNKNHKSYSTYGGKGVSVCNSWKNFDNFYLSMAPRPDGYTLDRLDSEGDYCPSNCRWATSLEQSVNRGSVKGSTSKYKGVCYHKATGKWAANLGYEYKNIYIGIYLSEKDAAYAYDKVAFMYYGKAVKLNFPIRE